MEDDNELQELLSNMSVKELEYFHKLVGLLITYKKLEQSK